ncbi:MAG TPA: deoxynucleoside kinase [Deltaproteobacteria bacterium]|nr:deoxynucleoside kinase [Deltaproteobacteria bacterium]
MKESRYIAVEGPIGVGTTSLAKLLASELGAATLLEEADANPFLERFYGDIRKYAFQTQIFFLLSRFQQLKELSQQELFDSMVVSDYLFAKDRIFACLNLDEDELTLYEKLYGALDLRTPKPDLVIYLMASSDVLEERIARRAKPYEREIGPDYLERLVDAYNRFFFYYDESPLLTINTTEIDFVGNPSDLSNLVKEIRSMKGGSMHYIPLGSGL